VAASLSRFGSLAGRTPNLATASIAAHAHIESERPTRRGRSVGAMPTLQERLQKLVTSAHAGVYRASGGRVGSSIGAANICLLTTTGRRSGRPRTTPVNYFPDGSRLVLVASNGGSDRHPHWYLNILDNGSVKLQRGSVVEEMAARPATPEEREELWPRITQWYRGYERYQQKTAREIPLVIVE
jgi:deazaflavin-dependent oxidoreductase (nitroreductase family)